jgi:hypothetical protein
MELRELGFRTRLVLSYVGKQIIKWFLLKSKASLTSKNHIPKQQRLQAATTKYLNFETQNHLLSGDQASWATENSHSLLSYLHHHTQTEGL